MRSWAQRALLRHKLGNGVPLIVAALAVTLAVSLCWLTSTKQVHIDDYDRTIVVRARAGTVGEVLAQAGVCLVSGDKVEPGIDQPVRSGMRITIRRSMPVTLVVFGEARQVRTCGQVVADVLQENGIQLGEGVAVAPAPEEPVSAGAEIKVMAVETKEVVEKVTIPYSQRKIEDSHLEAGLSRIVNPGAPGVKEVKLAVTYVDGKLASKKVISEKVIKQPVDRVVAMGTLTTLSRGGQTIRFKRALEVVATAYTPGPESNGIYTDGYTATGIKATYGVVAVDPKVIPLKSRLYVEGYGFAIAADTGGAIKGNRIDVCFDTVSEALKWGRRKVKVYILE
ncbi:MAG: G5 domain-containing protein [Bacillota bacterium]